MLILPALFIAFQAAPAAFEDLAALEARLVAAAGANIGAPSGPAHGLDRRLRLHRCPVAAEISPARGGWSAACPSLGWRVHVPLRGTGADPASGGPAIRRGDAVAVRMQGRGFAVVLRAVALEDGAVGARIRLRRTSGPAAPINAIVTGPGEAAPST